MKLNRRFRSVLFMGVLLAMLMHTFIHHPHSDEMNETDHIEFHQNNTSLINLLRIIFHEYSNENLENLLIKKVSKIRQFSFFPPVVIPSLNSYTIKVVVFEVKKDAREITPNDNKVFVVNSNGLRGPPIDV